ncbi:MAG: bifunctional 5,10-methylenetetrahydrofolate dehydrogenase/5,10-methenyltetrahydrofolate cyclohydrolase [Candidatus Omnitrophica bacterium]|nr:bifunctional 5,10-methylenetetrahydrofolate dehydrogenase/5,10-methenyltetrahydrofolate cyclohydrolase [Candidatus Omnitrophota bacterium]
MEAQLLEGKKIAEKMKVEIENRVEILSKKFRLIPTLRAIQVGEDHASELYLKSQKRAAESCEIQHEVTTLAATAEEKDLIGEIERANRDPKVHGIIVQMPLPKSYRIDRVLDAIHPAKDVEAVTTSNLGKLLINKEGLAPCTARACIRLIEETGANVYGKEGVVIGSSKVVGMPTFLLLIGKKVTSTICHTGTFKSGTLESHIRRADVLVVSAGKPNLIPGAWIKQGAIVIDVGINRVDGKTVGDIEFETAKKRAAFITPVPGGVGPLTTMTLMENLCSLLENVLIRPENLA